jgi:hypothetical protein
LILPNFRMNFKEVDCEDIDYLSGTSKGCSEHGNELLSSVKGGTVLNQLSDY